MHHAFDPFSERHKLAPGDRDALRSIGITPLKLARNQTLIEDNAFQAIVVEGYVARLKVTNEGRQQLVAVYEHGDLPRLNSLARSTAGADIISIGTSLIAQIRRKRLTQIAFERKTVAAALWREHAMQQSIAEEWLVCLGQKTAEQRVAFFFLERVNRMIGPRQKCIPFPFKQRHIASALGVSEVHVCRILQNLSRRGYLNFSHGMLKILNEEALVRFCNFSPSYIDLPLATL